MLKSCRALLFFCLLLSFSTVYAQIAPLNFPILSPAQANPFLTGMQAEMDIQSQMLENMEKAKELSELSMQEKALRQAENTSPGKIIIVSQNNPPIYLGCLDCNKMSRDSILNPSGSHMSRVGKRSIYNANSMHGSHRSEYSACNYRASRPPIVVTESGHVYGLLTLNTRLRGAITDPDILHWLKTSVCS